MPICQSCGNQWTWKQTIKTLHRLRCPYCGKKQYETASSRNRTAMVGLIPLIALPVGALLNSPWWMTLVLMAPMVAIIWSLFPYMIKLSEEQEPFW